MQSTLIVSIVNLTKNMLGAGMLSVPLGMALCGDLCLSVTLLLLAGAASGASFLMIGRCCRVTGEKTFRGICGSLLGPRSIWVIESLIFANATFACIALVVLIGDFSNRSVSSLLSLEVPRSACIIFVGSFLLIPLSLLSSLESLKFSSLLGLFATLYTFLFVCADAFNSPPRGAGVDWHISALKSWALFCTSFQCHYNAPRFFSELQNPTPGRFLLLTFLSFGGVTLVYLAFGLAGFRVFGTAVRGNVLESYEHATLGSMLAWLSMAVSLTFTYPLVFASLKESIGGLCGRSRWVTILLVSLTMLVASCDYDVSLFNAVKGATSASLLAFIIPPLLLIRATESTQRLLTTRYSTLLNIGCYLMMGCGGGLGLASVVYLLS